MSVALITGASAGIGVTFAEQLAARGCDLILVARRAERLAETARGMEKRFGVKAETLVADLASDGGVGAVAERIARETRLEYLVNNAGFGTRGMFFQTAIEGQDQMHRLHVLAAMRLTHAAVKGMVARDRGAVINVSSVAGFLFSAGSTSYCATKAWMNAFTEGLYVELKSAGSKVRVQALCPGYTLSEFHDVMGMDRSKIPGSLWMKAEFVVKESLAGLEGDRMFVIPGWRYRLAVRMAGVIPRGILHWGAVRAGRRLGKV